MLYTLAKGTSRVVIIVLADFDLIENIGIELLQGLVPIIIGVTQFSRS
jgi:hypothetical protein